MKLLQFPDDQDPRPDVGCVVKLIAIIGVLAATAGRTREGR